MADKEKTPLLERLNALIGEEGANIDVSIDNVSLLKLGGILFFAMTLAVVLGNSISKTMKK